MERISEAYKNEPTASQKNAVFDAMLGYFEGEMPAGLEHGEADREFSSGHWDYGLTDEYAIRIQTPDGIPGDAHFFSFARSQPSVVNALASAGYSEEDVEERSLSRAHVGYDYVELYLSVPRALEGGSFSVSSPDELADVLEREFGVWYLRDGFRGWVFPDGKPVSVPEGGNHKSLARWIADHVDYGGMRIPSTSGDGSPFVEDNIGGIRVNLAGEDYVRLNEKEPTREQYDALKDVFGLGRGISIHFPYEDAGEGHSTAVKTDPSKGAEYYLRLIRRFYSSGEYPRDYESLSRGKLKEAESAEEDSRGRPLSQGQASFFRNSKIRDRKGRLLACYHSTKRDFDEFSYKYSGTNGGVWGEGFYFSTRDDFIYAYGDKYVEAYLNVEHPWVIGASEGEIAALLRKYLGDKFDADLLHRSYATGYGDIYAVENCASYGREYTTFREVLEKCGYDGIIVGDPNDLGRYEDEIVVFRPNQIKRTSNANPSSSNKMSETCMTEKGLKEAKSLGGGVFATESPYEVKSVLNSAADEIKVLYDPRKRLYMYGKANDYIHNEMLEKAWEAGYYPGLNRWELPEYVERSDSNCLVYLWFIPGGDDGGRTIGVDDYTEEWVYPNGVLCARSHYSETPLYDQTFDLPRVLGKPKAIYAVKDWDTMEPQRVDHKKAFGESRCANESYLTEKTRQQLLDKSRNGAAYAPNNRAKGKNRYERRKYSKVAATIKDYNSIDMNAFFKGDYLEFGVPVHGETDDYVVTVTFERILPRLQQEVKSDKNRLSEKAVLRALLGAFNTGDVYVSCTCLHPDTRIKLLDGTNPTVAEMKERFDKGERLYVYSADGKGDFKPGEVEKVWVAKTTRDFVKVTLDDGQEILTTPDHPYMLRNGEYMEAKDLVPGTSLMHVDGVEHKVAKAERVTLEDTPVYDIQVKDWHNFALDAGVLVHNCADFTYSGFNYLAVKQDYNSNPIFGKAMQPPTIRNPNDDKGAACKHILRVLSDVSWMMNVARVIYNYIKVSRQLMQRNYAEIIFPKVYGRPYKGVVQMSIMDKDDMWGDALLQSDKRELDAVIAAAKQGRDVRGRFSQGNPYAFKKRDAQAGPTLSKGGIEDADDSRQPSDMHA